MMTLKDGFLSDSLESITLSFEVTNIRNPRSLKPTSFFTMQTLDSYGYSIEESLGTVFA
jgi:hypothetical protein